MKKLLLSLLAMALLCCPANADRPNDEIRLNLNENNKWGVSANTIWIAVSQLDEAGELDATDAERTASQVLRKLYALDPGGVQDEIGHEEWIARWNRISDFVRRKMPVVLKLFN